MNLFYFYPRLAQWINKQQLLICLFLILFQLLFLGDGKQSVVDIVFGICIIFVYFGVKIIIPKYHQFPFYINLRWLILFIYFFLNVVFSEHIVDSIYIFVRLMTLYVLYSICFEYGSQENKRVFPKMLLGFVSLVLIIAIILKIYPQLNINLPPMNQLLFTYGHNHIIDLLLFVIPIALSLHGLVGLLFFLLISIGVLFSLGRAGIFVFLVYSIIHVFKDKNEIRIYRIIKSFSLIITATVLLIMIYNPHVRELFRVPFVPSRSGESIYEGRIEYWKQARLAIQESPWFGSGLGTFFYKSRQYYTKVYTYSWFAHNSLLQLLVECGLIGAGLVIIMLYLNLQGIRKRFKESSRDLTKPTILGAVLVFGYSLIDFNLDFVTTLFILSCIAGLYGNTDNQKKSTNDRFSLQSIAIIGISAFVMVRLVIFGFNQGALIYLSFLYSKDSFKIYFSKKEQKISQFSCDWINHFYRIDSEVKIVLAQKCPQGGKYYFDSLYYDSHNIENFIAYILYLDNANKHEELIEYLNKVKPLLTTPSHPLIKEINSQRINYSSIELVKFIGHPKTIQDTISKTLYFIGFNFIEKDPVLTEKLWREAIDFSPSWGYYYVELSSLYKNILLNEKSANEILFVCQKDPYASGLCQVNLEHYYELIKVGEMYEEIKKI